MSACKSLETISGLILNQLQQKFAAILVANEMQCLKAIERPALTEKASVASFFKDF